MWKDLKTWHGECYECQIRAPKRYKVPLTMTRFTRPFERLGVDCCGPLQITKKGNLHYLLCICWYSKYVVTVPLPDTKALTVAKAVWENVILVYGVPKELLSDNAKTFTAEFFMQLCEMLGIDKTNSTPYHSDGNAVTERPFRTFHDMIGKYLGHAELEWDELLREVTFAYNTTPNETTRETPFFLMFGRDPQYPVDLLLHRDLKRETVEVKEFKQRLVRAVEAAREQAVASSTEMMERAKLQADRRNRDSDIMEGMLVLYRDYSLE